jgi:hypothetical protein
MSSTKKQKLTVAHTTWIDWDCRFALVPSGNDFQEIVGKLKEYVQNYLDYYSRSDPKKLYAINKGTLKLKEQLHFGVTKGKAPQQFWFRASFKEGGKNVQSDTSKSGTSTPPPPPPPPTM